MFPSLLLPADQADQEQKKRKHVFHLPKPMSTFLTFMDEGFNLYRLGHFRKALYCYDRALLVEPGNKRALVARSQCHLKLGDGDNALADAQASFDKKSTYVRGLVQYCDSLFNLGKFEHALLGYHHGDRMRKDIDVFRIGIEKCQTVILGAIGDRAATQIEDFRTLMPKIRELEYIKSKCVPAHCCIRPGVGEGMTHVKRKALLKPPSKAREKWVGRETLGELFFEKEYLNKLLERVDIKHGVNNSSKNLRFEAREALSYLRIRENFWRQVSPMYMKKEGLNFNNRMVRLYELEEKKRQASNRSIKMDAAQGAVLKNFRTIEHAIKIHRPKDSLLEVRRTFRQLKRVTTKLLPRKRECICQLFHYKGLSEYMQKKYGKAISSFAKELELTVNRPMTEIKVRALDCLAQVLFRKKMYVEAADAWETRLKVTKVPKERYEIFYKLGHCYSALNKLHAAENYVSIGLNEGLKAEDTDGYWLMVLLFSLGKIKLQQKVWLEAFDKFKLATECIPHVDNPDKHMVRKVRTAPRILKYWFDHGMKDKETMKKIRKKEIKKAQRRWDKVNAHYLRLEKKAEKAAEAAKAAAIRKEQEEKKKAEEEEYERLMKGKVRFRIESEIAAKLKAYYDRFPKEPEKPKPPPPPPKRKVPLTPEERAEKERKKFFERLKIYRLPSEESIEEPPEPPKPEPPPPPPPPPPAKKRRHRHRRYRSKGRKRSHVRSHQKHRSHSKRKRHHKQHRSHSKGTNGEQSGQTGKEQQLNKPESKHRSHSKRKRHHKKHRSHSKGTNGDKGEQSGQTGKEQQLNKPKSKHRSHSKRKRHHKKYRSHSKGTNGDKGEQSGQTGKEQQLNKPESKHRSHSKRKSHDKKHRSHSKGTNGDKGEQSKQTGKEQQLSKPESTVRQGSKSKTNDKHEPKDGNIHKRKHCHNNKHGCKRKHRDGHKHKHGHKNRDKSSRNQSGQEASQSPRPRPEIRRWGPQPRPRPPSRRRNSLLESLKEF